MKNRLTQHACNQRWKLHRTMYIASRSANTTLYVPVADNYLCRTPPPPWRETLTPSTKCSSVRSGDKVSKDKPNKQLVASPLNAHSLDGLHRFRHLVEQISHGVDHILLYHLQVLEFCKCTVIWRLSEWMDRDLPGLVATNSARCTVPPFRIARATSSRPISLQNN